MHMLIEFIEKYGLLAVFFNVLAESLGLPLPTYPILIIAASLMPSHQYGVADILLAGVTACLIGDFVWYGNGRYFGAKIVGFLCKISLSPDYCVRQTSDLTRRVGPVALTFTKFLPGLGTIAIVLSGVMRTSLRTFLFFDTIGAIFYISVAVAVGVIFRDAVDDVLKVIAQWGNWGLAVLALILSLYIAYKWWQRRNFINQLRMDRISVDELQALVNSDQKPMILDAQTEESREVYGVIPNAIVVDVHNVKSISANLSAVKEIVVYCSCPNEASAAFVAKQLKKVGFKKIRPLLGGIEAWKEAGLTINPPETIKQAS